MNLIYIGLTYADIELINAGDMEMDCHHVIGNEEIKLISSNMFVDIGANDLCIKEIIQAQ